MPGSERGATSVLLIRIHWSRGVSESRRQRQQRAHQQEPHNCKSGLGPEEPGNRRHVVFAPHQRGKGRQVGTEDGQAWSSTEGTRIRNGGILKYVNPRQTHSSGP